MRVRPTDPNNPPELVRAIFERSRDRYGQVITPALVMAHRPEILLASVGLGRAIDGSTVVEERLKTMASLRASQMIGCPF
jgi:hypothetical protein